jgi:hypothetical protein
MFSVPVVVAPPFTVSPPVCVPLPMVEEAYEMIPKVVVVGANTLAESTSHALPKI